MKKHNKQHVIEVGESLFRAKGFEATGTDELLRESEYPRSSFYYLFESKEQFASEVLVAYGDRLESIYIEVLSDKSIGTPYERLVYLFENQINVAISEEFKDDCLIYRLGLEAASISEQFRRSVYTELAKLLRPIELCIKEGIKDQSIARRGSAKLMANRLQSQYYSSYFIGKLSGRPQDSLDMLHYLLDDYRG